MFALFLTPDYAIFSAAFVIMIGIGLVEGLGLGIGHFDLDADLDGDVNGGAVDTLGLLNWLGLRRGLPILIWLTSFLGCFVVAGVAVQQIATAVFGTPLHWGVASIVAFVLGGAANGMVSAGLAHILPEYESTVIETDDLIMRRGLVLEGSARRGHPTRAKVVDQHGQAHYVMVEPHHDDDVIGKGETALLVRRDGSLFFAQSETGTEFRPI